MAMANGRQLVSFEHSKGFHVEHEEKHYVHECWKDAIRVLNYAEKAIRLCKKKGVVRTRALLRKGVTVI